MTFTELGLVLVLSMGLRVDARKDKRADEIVRIQQNLSTSLACAPTHQNVATLVGIALQG